jgi:hypothetical protein
MIIETRDRDGYKKKGTIRYKDGKVTVNLSSKGMQHLLKKVLGKTPEDGIEYMNAIVARFLHSSGVLLVKEDEDKGWLT